MTNSRLRLQGTGTTGNATKFVLRTDGICTGATGKETIMKYDFVKENLDRVEENIKNACLRAGRDRSEVTLIAVSKTKPVEMIKEAVEWGAVNFGENKVQELTDKIPRLPESLSWHMIGHLQRNKVKYIIGKTVLIHSVDSIRLAKQIDEESKKAGIITKILVEVNAAGEESKFGITVDEALPFVEEVSKMQNIKVCGLMTIAPYVENPEENRIYFQKLRQLKVDISKKNIDNVSMDILSMGMTGDYEVAIEEGATLVRVGTGIFGERMYNL